MAEYRRLILIRTVIWGLISLALLRADENYRQSEFLFDSQYIATISITIDPDSLAWILATGNELSDHYFRADMRFQRGELDTLVADIGFRLRGNTSRFSRKKSFKISFSEYVPDRRFFGLKKFNLNGEHNDPSLIRSKLCWDLYRQMNVPASRAVHVQLFINGEYKGLYIHVEEYDKTFVKSRFANNSGNLYKCLWPADLAYRAENPDAYKFVSNDRRAYELQTNEEVDDYSDLAHLIRVINLSNATDFRDSLAANINIWNFLKYLAVNVTVGSWDDYWYNKNNYFLYHNLRTGKFEFLPYDCDNTFGICWDSHDWGTRNIFHWGNSNDEARPLVDRLFSYPQFKNLYAYFIRVLVEEYFTETTFYEHIDSIKNRITPAVTDDIYRTLDYGYTVADFQASYTTALGAHVRYGLQPYIATRRHSIMEQLPAANVAPYFIAEPEIETNGEGNTTIRVPIFDEHSPAIVNLIYRHESDFIAVPMQLDSILKDGPVQIYRFTASINELTSTAELQFYLSATDDNNQTSVLPYAAPAKLFVQSFPFRSPKVYINEFMASNATTATDEYGQYDDWVEIFCATDTVVLTNFFLTDNIYIPDKWAFPDTILPPQSHLIVWADDHPEQGRLHAPFKLDKSGEALAIFQKIDSVFFLIDSVTFGAQTTDISYGRTSDGDSTWSFMTPTPGAPNTITQLQTDINLADGFRLFPNYPNPFNQQTRLSYYLPKEGFVQISVYDLNGRIVRYEPPESRTAGMHSRLLNFSSLTSGVYLVCLENGQKKAWQKCLYIK